MSARYLLLAYLLLSCLIFPCVHAKLNLARVNFGEKDRSPTLKELRCSRFLPSHPRKGDVRFAPLLPQPEDFKEEYGDFFLRAWAKCTQYTLIHLIPKRGFGRYFSSPRYNIAHPLRSRFGIRGAYKQRDKLRHYELMKFLGSGSFGSVYSGTWYKSPHPGEEPTPVAIKYIKREDKPNGLSIHDMTKFFFTEVMAMVAAYSLAPFGVIQPFDVDLSDQGYWVLIMEKADGSLNNIPDDKVALAKFAGGSVTESKLLSERLIMHLYIEPIRAIRLINAAGITHRDINNDNLLYKCSEKVCHVKLADFGLSVLSVKDLRLRKAGQSGTEGYHPLSLLRPGSTIEDKKTVDVYAIFASMHDALCYPRGTQIIPEEERNWPTLKDTKFSYVPRSWKGGIFDERPISKELDDILKQVLLPLSPGYHVPSMADLDVLLHKWVYLFINHKEKGLIP